MKSKDQILLEEAYRKVLENVSGIKNQSYWYLGANCTVDLVVIYKGKILLIQRKAGGIEGGKWAIPGGFIDTDSQKGEVYRIGKESPKQAALRELQEETNLDLSSVPNIGSRLKEVGVYEGNNRDPRDNDEAWSKSYAFTITLKDEDGVDFSAMRGMDDASDARWFSVDKLPSDLAFDHAQIINDSFGK
jgi:ADP-ribose pyrophosphatase YjhB (NUDIX family)